MSDKYQCQWCDKMDFPHVVCDCPDAQRNEARKQEFNRRRSGFPDYDAVAAQLATANDRLRQAESEARRLVRWLDGFVVGHLGLGNAKAKAIQQFWRAWLAGSAGGSQS